MDHAAAIMKSEFVTPQGFALIDTVPIPEKLTPALARILEGRMEDQVEVTRQDLIGLMTIIVSIMHDAGAQYADRSREIRDGGMSI